ncbi:MAG: DUF2283 domain-containing protein [Phycisphaerae bacterium]
MLFTMDTQANALYIKVREGNVSVTKETMPEVFVDYNAKNEILGIELVSPCVTTIRKIAKKLHLPLTKHLKKFEELCQM